MRAGEQQKEAGIFGQAEEGGMGCLSIGEGGPTLEWGPALQSARPQSP